MKVDEKGYRAKEARDFDALQAAFDELWQLYQGEANRYRCFHCRQQFDYLAAREHFATLDEFPLCVQMFRSGSGGGIHDAFIRVRKDYWDRVTAALAKHGIDPLTEASR